ncbi:glycosyltransferase family 2 protein [Kiritimatiellota bacterium B12222]|nr:glycosyltransferase family 2 protein [Kiritimatiellota bacterium B12222]
MTSPRNPGISLLVHTRNSQDSLEKTLASAQGVDEVLIIDMESADNTLAIAKKFGARILSIPPNDRVDEIRNTYLEEVSFDWTLVLDSDEFLPADGITTLQALRQQAHSGNYDAVKLPRYNIIADRVLTSCGWYPDQQLRFFKTGFGNWGDGHHHSPTCKSGEKRTLTLQPPQCLHIHHQNYKNFREVIQKQLHYALSDHYDSDEKPFEFQKYVMEAYDIFAERHDVENEGDFATALATIMAWDQVIRGLIHWDDLGRSAPLMEAFSLPIRTQETELASTQEDLKELHAQHTTLRAQYTALQAEKAQWQAIQATRWYRFMQGLINRFPRLIAKISNK